MQAPKGDRRTMPGVVARRSASDHDPQVLFRTETRRTRLLDHSQALRPLKRVTFAGAVLFRIVAAYWSARQVGSAHLRSLREPFTAVAALEKSVAEEADDVGVSFAQLESAHAGYVIGATYAALLPPNLRARHGIYYTPPALVTRLLDQATAAGVDWAQTNVLDPSCGGGAFLAPVALRIIKSLSHLDPRDLIAHIASHLRGWEIDPVSAWLAQVLLEVELLPYLVETARPAPLVVEVCDSIGRAAQEPGWSLIIGNPPYGRISLSSAVRAEYSRSLYGHANLYGLFTDLALRLTKPGGVVAFVTPTSFLSGEYYLRLRALLSRESPHFTLDLVHVREGVFEGVLQETLLATYRRAGVRQPCSVNVIYPCAEPADIEVTPLGTVQLPSEHEDPWVLPRDLEQATMLARLGQLATRLRDWGYTVRTGPLVWNRHKRQRRRRAGPGRFPLIWAEAVTTDGRFVFRADKKNHLPFFEPRVEDGWLLVRQPCVLIQRTTAKEQSRRLIAAELPTAFLRNYGAVIVENHLNMVCSTTPQPLVSRAVLATFLNSRAADRVFRCLSGSVAVSAYELEAMPLPAPASLADLGQLIAGGTNRERIEEACDALYGLD